MTIRSIGVVLHDLALGGTERIAVRLARRWADEGIAVSLFCGDVRGPLKEFVGDRVRLVPLSPHLPRARGSMRKLARAAAEAVANVRPDALFVPGNYHWPVAARVAAAPTNRRPIVVAQVSAALRKPQRSAARQFFYDRRMRGLLRDVDGLVTLSETAHAQALTILPGTTVRTIPTPALDDDMPPPLPAGGRTVMAAGRLVPEKGYATLIEAFARIEEPDARLVIVGDGPERERLRALGDRLGLGGRLELPGYQPDIRPWLDRARLYVLSSLFEGYPAVMIEAFAAGRPIVATDCTPATVDLLSAPERGRVVPIGDPESMACAIAAMLAEPAPDPAELATAVARHQLSESAAMYLDLFETLQARR